VYVTSSYSQTEIADGDKIDIPMAEPVREKRMASGEVPRNRLRGLTSRPSTAAPLPWRRGRAGLGGGSVRPAEPGSGWKSGSFWKLDGRLVNFFCAGRLGRCHF
jgi:hypothetical protein